MTTALLLLAQADPGKHTQETTSIDVPLIIGTLLLVALIAALIWFVFIRSAKVTKGGVEAPPGSQQPGNPPFESIGRERGGQSGGQGAQHGGPTPRGT
jgi:hypothetical protein